MATLCKLNLTFKDATGTQINMSFNHANKTAAPSVRALMEGIIANSGIYSHAPASIVKASFIETTETPVSL